MGRLRSRRPTAGPSALPSGALQAGDGRDRPSALRPARPPEKDLRRAILCDRKALVLMGEITTECPGDCLAHLLGWHGMYATPLLTRKRGWRTPTRGDLGAGWPDLTMASDRTRRVLFAELKRSDGDDPEPDQAAVLRVLRQAGAEVYVWRWRDLEDGTIMRILRSG